ncbi:hypothetical protein [Demequina sp. NBRC 110057]|uniref:PGAP1-like alpha/beta domain-containing protein n=1 Tax=Demequina sp. NBRC 110057 TaxID=1570346 RepID=UPI000A02513A|nr:hypothetical protein [Demequina sp. NBRC 110057]
MTREADPIPVGVAGGAGGTEAVTEDLEAASAVLADAGEALEECRRALDACLALLDDAQRHAGPAVVGAVTRADAAAGLARWGTSGAGALERDAHDLAVRVADVARTYADAEERARGGIGLVTAVQRYAADTLDTGAWLTRAVVGLGWALSVPGTIARLTGDDPVGGALAPDEAPGMTGYLNRGTVGALTATLGATPVMGPSTYDAILTVLRGMLGALDTAFEASYDGASPRGPRTSSDVPRSMADLAAGLESFTYVEEGVVAVDELVGADGVRRYVVTIPGTYDNGFSSVNPFDWHGNGTVEAGGVSDAMRLTVDAMERMGIPPGAEVMLVGHSQGGMVATAVAGARGIRERFRITDVVTFGSPVADLPHVEGVTYAHVEDVSDSVPALDKGGRDEGANVTTWSADARASSDPAIAAAATGVLSVHAMSTYRATAGAIDALTDPSTQAWKRQVSGYTTSLSATRTLFSPTAPRDPEQPVEGRVSLVSPAPSR